MTLDELFDAARGAMAKSHSPYSKFPVGAAILTEDGSVFAGANMEVISFPEGWCAETSALAHYVMAGGGRITDICVTASRMDECTPCGGCRQRLAEFAPPDARIHLTDQAGITKTITMAELLPLGFETEVLSS
ncbi:cytidine deaminase [Oricola sp.]|uniref:cytidine deaminase n=1 Tax=Oricola sp. TaxID=1979950 RepID=UPI0025DC400B|nr:cytidine deaminase [Oricola sp.]MCI5077676.1 cytidine deaminase [Oricola sp.]